MTNQHLPPASQVEAETLGSINEALDLDSDKNRPPIINTPWPEQGGIFIGTRLIDGVAHHVVIAEREHDHIDVEFARVDKVVAEGDEINGFSDWRAPDQEDLMLAYVNAREHFDTGDWYWSRSEHHGWPWAVDFEYGRTDLFTRSHEFRVRPVRSFPASPIRDR